MAITDKTRKILWGRSGNRCAICRRELVIDATPADDESVVGEECHIISGRGQGPRYDGGVPEGRIDDADNLVLLCRVHHKMVDDQCETYTAGLLRNLKLNHEKWVSSSLAEQTQVPPVRIRRIKENVPPFLSRVLSGQEIMNIAGGSFGYLFDHEEPVSAAEAEMIATFLQEIQDWAGLWDEIEAGGRVKASFGLTERLRQLEEAGLWLFGAREVRRLEGGTQPPSPWPVAILKVVRANSSDIAQFASTPEQYPKNDSSPDIIK
jgi:HNH endonuclease